MPSGQLKKTQLNNLRGKPSTRPTRRSPSRYTPSPSRYTPSRYIPPLAPPPPRRNPTITDLVAILLVVDIATTLVCNEIDKAPKPEHEEERQALKNLREGVENMKSDIMLYEVLLSPMARDTPLSLRQQYVMGLRSSSYADMANNTQYYRVEGMEGLENALKATRLVLEENPAGNPHDAMMDPFGSENRRRALRYLRGVIKDDFLPRDLLDFILKDATSEIFVCQRNNERAFKFVWYRHVTTSPGRRIPSPKIDNTSHYHVLISVLDAFRVNPFAVSPERTRIGNGLHTFAILNRNHEATTRHERLARQIGKAWVDVHVRESYLRVQELDVLQTSLFELLWSGTVEQLKQHNPHSSDDPERPEFERAVEDLDRVLRRAIVRSKKQHFSIAFCGAVKAGKSMILNALMGMSILPSDGEYDDSCTSHPPTEHHCRAPFYSFAVQTSPCRRPDSA